MLKLNKNDRYYYQKKGGLYFLCISAVNVLCMKFLFMLAYDFDLGTLSFFVDSLLILLSGPINFIFIGHVAPRFYIPLILLPVLFLMFVRTDKQFETLVKFFLFYWLSWGAFILFIYSIS